MLRFRSLATYICSFLLVGCASETGSQGKDFLSRVNQTKDNVQDDSSLLTFFERERTPLDPVFSPLPTGSTRPAGWLRELMSQDLEKGIVGALDELYPGIRADDLYHADRRGGLEDVPEMGDLVLTGEAWEQSIMWWNAETIGNWWDGFVRHAFLLEDEAAMAQSRTIANHLLASQDEDGYIGIYKENLRYQHEGSNGELWAQTTAFRTLLAYYEMTEEERVLEAVERAVNHTMGRYSTEGRHPFLLKTAFGGVTHGLMFTDVCETLYRITGNKAYDDYAVYLYEAFSTYSINRAFNDLRYPFLLERDSLFTGHAVHTYEHFRSLLQAYYATGYTELEQAYNNANHKLEQCLLPSGAGHGNEWIAGLAADPDETATEFCSMLELRNSLMSAAQKTGNSAYADQAEKLTFNGIMGFRNEDGTAITYGKGDNCRLLDGHHHGKKESHVDPRYKYSPTHSDPAVCCVPNYARNFPYYLDQMWGQAEDGLVALVYGPAKLAIDYQGISLSVEQTEPYPFSDRLVFRLQSSAPQTFAFYFRKPAWSEGMQILAMGASVTTSEGFYRVEKEWQSGDEIEVVFEHNTQQRSIANGQTYLQRGPLVYAYAIPHREKTIKQYEGSEFRDYYCFPEDDTFEDLQLLSGQTFDLRENARRSDTGLWQSPPFSLQGECWNAARQESQVLTLVPVGSTILRQLTFPVKEG